MSFRTSNTLAAGMYGIFIFAGMMLVMANPAQAVSTVADGDWSNVAIWDTGEPTASDLAIISNAVSITAAGEVAQEIQVFPSGTLAMSGGTLQTGDTLPNASTIIGGMTLSGGTWTAAQQVHIEGGATFTISGGSFALTSASPDYLVVGRDGAGSGTLIIEGSNASISSVNFSIGHVASGTGTLVIRPMGNGALSPINVSNDFFFGDFGNSVLTVDAQYPVCVGDSWVVANYGTLSGASLVFGAVNVVPAGVTVSIDYTTGNAITVTVLTAPADTTPPVISLNGSGETFLQCGDPYTEAGATASDNCDGDISANIIIGGDTVDSGTPGFYNVTYNVSDSTGNAAFQMQRSVMVQDTTAPVISLNGSATLTVECGSTYTEAATASDACDLNLPAITIGGDIVDTSVFGDYVITYDVTDANSNAAVQVTRTVTVADNTGPTITLNGNAAPTLECGGSYTEEGASASDTCDLSLPAVTIGGDTVDTNTPGTYVVTYDVTDVNGNAAVQVLRTVTVEDTGVPTITLIGSATATIECGSGYTEEGASASDTCDLSLPAVTIGGDTVDTNTPGGYVVTYDVSDASGNDATQVTRTITVEDTTAPTITLNGSATVSIECSSGAFYTEDGATASDACDTSLPAVTVGGDDVDEGTPGTYVVTYDVSDINGNAATQVTRTVTVEDTTGPVLSVTGDEFVTLECGDAYVELGATASEDCDTSLPAVTIGGDTVDTSTPGDYTVTYGIVDASGNGAATVTRNITVTDTIGPTLTLLGNASVTVPCRSVYTDAGATAIDTCEGDISATIIVDNPVDTSVPGVYTVTYNVSDSSTNGGGEISRTVTVDSVCIHSADQNGDFVMSLSELLRVIQLYNIGALHCDVSGEDGYNPGSGDQSCTPHDSDYLLQDWVITLSEVLRLIQFYSSLSYTYCSGVGEDGFCPGTP